MIKEFEDYIKQGIVKKQSSNILRANFLAEEAKTSYEGLIERLNKIGTNNKNANSIIKDCYDIIMELIRSKMLLKGYNSSGYGAHEAEVSFTKKLKFKESETNFLDKLRYYRNGMIYYGTILDEEYANKVVKFTKEIFKRLI